MLMEKHRGALRAVLVLAVASASAAGADWPTWQHDNQRTGITPERLAPPLSVKWVFESPLPPARGWARPVTGYNAFKNASNVSFDDSFRVTSADGTVYFCSSAENKVYAIDASTGAVKWTFYTNAPPRLAPTIWKGKVYFGSDDGTAYCLDAADGEVVWKFDCAPTSEKMLGTGRLMSLWPMRTGVMVEDGVAYFTAGLFPAEGVYLYAVDAEDGRLIWLNDHMDEGGRGGPSPQGYLLAATDSIFMTSRVAPTRWSKKDGSKIGFKTPCPSVKYASYRYYNGGSYALLWDDRIVYGQGCLLAFDPEKVTTDKWGRKHKGDMVFNWFNGRRAIFKDDLAYIATDHFMMAVPHKDLPEMGGTLGMDLFKVYWDHNVPGMLAKYDEIAEHGEDSPRGLAIKRGNMRYGVEKFRRWPGVAEKLFEKIAKRCKWMLRYASFGDRAV